jgi:hypothetical protein
VPTPEYSSQSTTVEEVGVDAQDDESAAGRGDVGSLAAVSRAAGEQNSGESELRAPAIQCRLARIISATKLPKFRSDELPKLKLFGGEPY